MSELGSLLVRARQARGLTLEDAERDTRISRRYLAALEAEDFEVIPAPVFARGFLRSYSQYLGLDPVEVLALFPRDDAGEPDGYDTRRPTRENPIPGQTASRPSWRQPAPTQPGRAPAPQRPATNPFGGASAPRSAPTSRTARPLSGQQQVAPQQAAPQRPTAPVIGADGVIGGGTGYAPPPPRPQQRPPQQPQQPAQRPPSPGLRSVGGQSQPPRRLPQNPPRYSTGDEPTIGIDVGVPAPVTATPGTRLRTDPASQTRSLAIIIVAVGALIAIVLLAFIIRSMGNDNAAPPTGTGKPTATSPAGAGNPNPLTPAATAAGPTVASSGMQTTIGIVPSVKGKSQAVAEKAVAEAGFTPILKSVPGPAEKGTVSDQSPAGGAQLAPGQNVTLVISLGPN